MKLNSVLSRSFLLPSLLLLAPSAFAVSPYFKPAPRVASLDGQALASMAEVQQALAGQLHFPASYGNNLPSLWEQLTIRSGASIRIRLTHFEALKEHLGRPDADDLLELLTEASGENPGFRVEISR